MAKSIVAICLLGGLATAVWYDNQRGERRSRPQEAVAPRKRTDRPTPSLPDSLHKWQILENRDVPISERVKCVAEIRTEISVDEVSYLLGLVEKPIPEAEQERWWVIVNEILKKLRSCPSASELYSDTLCGYINNQNLHEVVRDYSVQHLCQWLAPVGDTGNFEKDGMKAERALRVVVEAISAPENQELSIPGTALLALHELSLRQPDFDGEIWNYLNSYLSEVVSRTAPASTSNQISAIQISGMRKLPASIGQIRVRATDVAENPSIRLASISALGMYGEQIDKPLLEAIALSGGKFQYAAKAALSHY